MTWETVSGTTTDDLRRFLVEPHGGVHPDESISMERTLAHETFGAHLWRVAEGTGNFTEPDGSERRVRHVWISLDILRDMPEGAAHYRYDVDEGPPHFTCPRPIIKRALAEGWKPKLCGPYAVRWLKMWARRNPWKVFDAKSKEE